MGLSIAELDYLTMGQVFDMFTEQANDTIEYDYKATQEDMDRL